MKVNIFATSDVHGRIYPYDYEKDSPNDFSLAQIYTAYKETKTKNSILVDNGDFIQGNFIEEFVEEEINPAIKIMNKMGYEIWNMGNHEFNFGLLNLKRLIGQFKGTSLLANSNSDFFKAYHIASFEDVKIAFIGIDTILINYFESPIFLQDFRITDPICLINDLIKDLRKDVSAIVGLFHIGLEKENAINHSGVFSVLDCIDSNFDLIIAGHSHQEIENLIYKNTLICQPSSYAKKLAKIELEFENKTLLSKSSSLIDAKNFKPDLSILSTYKEYNDKILAYTHKLIGYLKALESTYNYDLEDGPLIHLMTNIMMSFESCDLVSFQIDKNPPIKNGPFTRTDMAKLYTYAGGEVTIFEITGSDLKKYINWSYDYFVYENGLDLNPKRANLKYKTLDIFGNIKYKIDYRKKDKLIYLKYINGKNIEDDDILKIGMNEYRMNFLVSEEGVLRGKSFKKISSSKKFTKDFKKYGTIRELAEQYFASLDHMTFEYDNTINFEIFY